MTLAITFKESSQTSHANQDEQIKEMVKGRDLSKLFLVDVRKATDLSCLSIGQSCQHLRELSIGVSNITAVGLLCLANHCKNLEYLSLAQDETTLFPISEETISALLTYHKNLQVFHISQSDPAAPAIDFDKITSHNFFYFMVISCWHTFQPHTNDSQNRCRELLKKILGNKASSLPDSEMGIICKPKNGEDGFRSFDTSHPCKDTTKNWFMIKRRVD